MQLVDSDREKGLKPVVWGKYRNIIEKYEKNVSFLLSPLKAIFSKLKKYSPLFVPSMKNNHVSFKHNKVNHMVKNVFVSRTVKMKSKNDDCDAQKQ